MLYGKIVFFTIEGLLLLMVILAIFKGLFEWIERRRSNLSYEVKRGEKSMKAIITGFIFFGGVYTVIVSIIDFFNEYKVLFYVVNYISLGYLFFFSFWFRNRIFFPILKTIHKG